MSELGLNDRRFWAAWIAVVAVLWLVVMLRLNRPVLYEPIEDHFKYGSIGSEPGVSLLQPVGGVLPPYWVFTALPSVCSDKLPGGYASLGFITEPGHDLPVGVSRRRRRGLDHVGLNCAVLSHRHGSRFADRHAAHRAGHAGASARPAAVRRVRARLHARQPDDSRQRSRTFS